MLRETSLNDDLELHGSASHTIDFAADAPQRGTLSASLISAASQFNLAAGELLSPDPLPSPQQLHQIPVHGKLAITGALHLALGIILPVD